MTDLSAIRRHIDDALPEIARDVIRGHLDLEDAANRAFLSEPDARDQHKAHWHQWGIITHTRVFLRHFEGDIPHYLREWHLWKKVDELFATEIDGAARWDLLPISILLHDVGKFAARTRGSSSFHFTGHEVKSGEIIRRQLALGGLGLTPSQIEYVARTAEDHFVLGLVRKRAREQGTFDISFTESEQFATLAGEIKRAHPEDFTEVGVLFLGDSLAKSDPVTGPEMAAGQYAINVAVARRYLELVLVGPSL